MSTADAYRWVAESRAGRPPVEAPFDPPARADGWLERLAGCRNDFEPVVAARHPEIAEAVATLRAAGARLAMMSGSGSAVFGLFADAGTASRAMAPLAARPGWRGWLSATSAVRESAGEDPSKVRSRPTASGPRTGPAQHSSDLPDAVGTYKLSVCVGSLGLACRTAPFGRPRPGGGVTWVTRRSNGTAEHPPQRTTAA